MVYLLCFRYTLKLWLCFEHLSYWMDGLHLFYLILITCSIWLVAWSWSVTLPSGDTPQVDFGGVTSNAEKPGKLAPRWEGPYVINEVLGKGAYTLKRVDGTLVPRTWNAQQLRRCYMWTKPTKRKEHTGNVFPYLILYHEPCALINTNITFAYITVYYKLHEISLVRAKTIWSNIVHLMNSLKTDKLLTNVHTWAQYHSSFALPIQK